MVELKVKVGPKGQIVIPKALRDKLAIKTGDYVYLDLNESKNNIIIEKQDPEELIQWLRTNRKPLVKSPIRSSLEDEFQRKSF